MGLIGKQQQVADEALDVLTRENYYSDHHVYISGEMGVGKTFMASYIVSKTIANRGALICVPRTVLKKWERVLREYCGNDVKISTFGESSIKSDQDLAVAPNEITLMDEKLFNRVFKPYVTYADGKNNRGERVLESARATKAMLSYLKNAPLLVLDEVHTFNGVRLLRYQKMLQLIYQLRKSQTLGLGNYQADGSLKYKYLPLWDRNTDMMSEVLLKDSPGSNSRMKDIEDPTKRSVGNPFGANVYQNTHVMLSNLSLLDEEGIPYDEVESDLTGHVVDSTFKIADTYFPALYLSGTVFNTDLVKLYGLLVTTHQNTMRIASKTSATVPYTNMSFHSYFSQGNKDYFRSRYGHNIANFITNIWRYISISISLDDLKGKLASDVENEVHQTVEPIALLAVTDEQRALYELIGRQLKTLGLVDTKAFREASTYLDNPEKRLEYHISKGRTPSMVGTKYNNFVGLPLSNVNFKETSKYLKLLDILKGQGKQKRTLLYVNESDLMDKLEESLIEDGYVVGRLPIRLDQQEYSKYINGAYANGVTVFLVDPLDISVGVDIEADSLVWYQLMSNIPSMIQAQRRVYRLSSKQDSKVYFLAYKLTYQDTLVNEISNATKYNAATYGVQQKDNLAKLTGVLLGDLKK